MMGGRVVSVCLAVGFDVDSGDERCGEPMVKLVFDIVSDVMSLLDAQLWTNGDRGGDA